MNKRLHMLASRSNNESQTNVIARFWSWTTSTIECTSEVPNRLLITKQEVPMKAFERYVNDCHSSVSSGRKGKMQVRHIFLARKLVLNF